MSSSTLVAPAVPDAPEEYPWVGPAVRSALLLEDEVVDLEPAAEVEVPAERLAEPRGGELGDTAAIEQALAAAGAAPLAERTLVLAVGSNQTPRTIAGKYRRSGRVLQVATPFVSCTVRGLAVGHVPRPAARGYLPAAPYRADGERMELVATWFDAEQLAVVDETEPNYDRVSLPTARFPVSLATGGQPVQIDVYASRWGILAHGGPIPLRHRQQELFDELMGITGDERLVGDAAEICSRLAADPDGLQELIRGHGLVVPDGLPRR